VAGRVEAGGHGPKDSSAPGVQADGEVVSAVKWFEGDLEAALAAAKAQGKRVFVDVGAYWCPPCRKLDEEVFIKAGGRGGAGARVRGGARRRGEGRGAGRGGALPGAGVSDAAGARGERAREGADGRRDGAGGAARGAREDRGGGDVLAELEAAVAAKPDDLEARYRLGNAYALAAKRAEADAALAAVIAGDPDNARAGGEGDGRPGDVPGGQAGRRPERAIALYKELQQKFPKAKESLRAYRQIGRELHKLGRDDEAVASLEAMIAAEPDNVDLKASYGWFSFRERCRPEAGLRAVEAGLAVDAEEPGAALPAGRAQASARRRGRGAGQHPRGGRARAGVGVLQAAGPALRGEPGAGAGGRGVMLADDEPGRRDSRARGRAGAGGSATAGARTGDTGRVPRLGRSPRHASPTTATTRSRSGASCFRSGGCGWGLASFGFISASAGYCAQVYGNSASDETCSGLQIYGITGMALGGLMAVTGMVILALGLVKRQRHRGGCGARDGDRSVEGPQHHGVAIGFRF
jgi:tetratricopeptide (TPR) repeat protein